jgi:hypothetical protein
MPIKHVVVIIQENVSFTTASPPIGWRRTPPAFHSEEGIHRPRRPRTAYAPAPAGPNRPPQGAGRLNCPSLSEVVKGRCVDSPALRVLARPTVDPLTTSRLSSLSLPRCVQLHVDYFVGARCFDDYCTPGSHVPQGRICFASPHHRQFHDKPFKCRRGRGSECWIDSE